MPMLKQSSFTGGELDPEVQARAGIEPYGIEKVAVGLGFAENMIITAKGGAKNRSGFKHVALVKTNSDTTKAVRLVRFRFNVTQTYTIEFGDLYARFYSDGGAILESTQNISSISLPSGSPVQLTITAHGYSNGDDIEIADVGGTTELNGRRFTVTNATVNTVDLTGTDGDDFTAYTSGGTAARVYTLTTTYSEADLFDLRFTQSADVMTIVHPGYDIRELARVSDTNWTLTTVTIGPTAQPPTSVALTVGASGGSMDIDYWVTAEIDGEESIAAKPDAPLRGANNPTPGNGSTYHKVTWVPNTSATTYAISGGTKGTTTIFNLTSDPTDEIEVGDRVYVTGHTGVPLLSDTAFYVKAVTSSSVTLDSVDSSGYGGAMNASGTIAKITADKFNIYKMIHRGGTTEIQAHGVAGYVGSSALAEWSDDNIAPTIDDTPPKATNPFDGSDNRPTAVGYYQQRIFFGGTNNKPQTIFGSVTGAFDNFNKSDAVKADDALQRTIDSLEINFIQHIVPMQDLLVLTNGGPWRVFGDQDGFIGPTSINIRPQEGRGSSHLRPLVVGKSVLYVEEGQQRVLDLTFDLQTDGYVGNDLTILAEHLFRDAMIVDWAYAQNPDGLIWAVLDNGDMRVLTFLREHQVWAWVRATSPANAKFESVSTVKEGTETAVYVVVRRTINGAFQKSVERLQLRKTNLDDAFFVDAGLTYDDPNARQVTNVSQATTARIGFNSDGDYVEGDIVEIYGVTTMTEANEVQLIVVNDSPSPNGFDVARYGTEKSISSISQANPAVVGATGHGRTTGDTVWIRECAGMTNVNDRSFTITVIDDDSFSLDGEDSSAYPAYTGSGKSYQSFDTSAFTAYGPVEWNGGYMRRAVTSFTGAWHLEGETIAVVADGLYVGDKTVTNGGFSVTNPASMVHAGLKYNSDMETLDLERATREGETLRGKPIKVSEVAVQVLESRRFKVGPNSSKLKDMRWPTGRSYDDAGTLITDELKVEMASAWDHGRVYIRQDEPLPLHVLGVAMDAHHG